MKKVGRDITEVAMDRYSNQVGNIVYLTRSFKDYQKVIMAYGSMIETMGKPRLYARKLERYQNLIEQKKPEIFKKKNRKKS